MLSNFGQWKGAYPVGRRNKAYSKDLHQQAYDRLTGMQALGESKKRQRSGWVPFIRVIAAPV